MALTKQQKLSRRAKLLGLNATGTAKQLEARIEAYYNRKAKKESPKRGKAKRKPRRKTTPKRKPRRDTTPKRKRPGRHPLARKVGDDAAWRKLKPDNQRERDEILAFCGPQCFADAGLTFPICPECDKMQCYCHPECGALEKAYKRGLDPDTMLRYGQMMNCGWVPPIYDVGMPALAPPKKDMKKEIKKLADNIESISDIVIETPNMVALFSRTNDVWVIETVMANGKTDVSDALDDDETAGFIRSIPHQNVLKVQATYQEGLHVEKKTTPKKKKKKTEPQSTDKKDDDKMRSRIVALQKVAEQRLNKSGPERCEYKLELSKGRTYWKLMKWTKCTHMYDGKWNEGWPHSFIEIKTGDIYMPNQRSPDKSRVRGNIWSENGGIESLASDGDIWRIRK